MNCKKIYNFDNISYSDWSKLDVDWTNQSKLDNSIPSYFFHLNGYKKGLVNNHILKSVFGLKKKAEILEDIRWWFNNCRGAYNEIIYYETKQ